MCDIRLQGIPSLNLSGRKLWYVWGSFIVLVCFMGVFAFSPFGSSVMAVVYFTICASLFNVGWAMVSHHRVTPE